MKKKTSKPIMDRIDLDYSITPAENLASSIVHMIGFGLNLTTAALLIVFSALKGNAIQIISFSIFAAFMNIYYIFSVLYHSLINVEAKKVFKILERCSGYLILIGIFIPLTLIAMNGMKGWIYLSIFIFLNLAGIVTTAIYGKMTELLITIIQFLIFIYIILFFILNFPLVSIAFMIWIAIALIFFLSGLILEEMKGIKFNHALGHLCLLLANISIFFGFFFYLI